MRLLISLSLICLLVSACRSQPSSENLAATAAPSNEYQIVIPEGTGALIEAGENPGVIPDEIFINLQEQDVLTIVNHDSVYHLVGPFLVQAGETLQQKFRKPIVYEGGCSIHPDNRIRIVVVDDETSS